ncbi:hypothetical protein GC176_13690 [bacterium]|nr:hypothetical protein [bacterium]
MSSQLGHLRNQLARLQKTRQSIRLATAASLLLKALVAILVVAFLADWTLRMSVLQRVVLLGLVAAAVVWAFRRLALPWLKQSDDLVELALMVERQQGIDSDLVSALQFEQPDAAAWGSPQLEQAVVATVARRSSQINVMEGLPIDDLKRRVIVCGVVLVIAAGAVLLAPGYVFAFFQRLLLSDVSYPTRTRLDEIRINDSAASRRVSSPAGHPVRFAVLASGELPASGRGRIRVVSLDGGVSTEVVLASAESKPGLFAGELPRLTDSVTFQVFLGDARSREIRIDAVPLPVVELSVEVTPPKYAADVLAREESRDASGLSRRQIAVLSGSRIDLTLTSLNKPLTDATLWIEDEKFPLTPADRDGMIWRVDPQGTPLASVDQPFQYRVEATDRQELKIESPLHGTVRLRTDQSPRVALSARTRRVIPTAHLPVEWSASDDFGLASVTARVQISTEEGEVSETEIPIVTAAPGKPTAQSLRDTFRIDLAALKLNKGDELRVTFAATDFRGNAEPQTSYSEPVLLNVTDRQGILSGLLETDEDSAQQLDAIIRRELGIGETR